MGHLEPLLPNMKYEPEMCRVYYHDIDHVHLLGVLIMKQRIFAFTLQKILGLIEPKLCRLSYSFANIA